VAGLLRELERNLRSWARALWAWSGSGHRRGRTAGRFESDGQGVGRGQQ